MKKNILILQNTILHYRKAFYNELSKYYKVTVLHSGKQSVCDEDLYSEIITKSYKVGGFYIQRGVSKEIKKGIYDVVIAMSDLRWINNLLAIRYRKKIKFIWWGAWLTQFVIADKIRIYLSKRVDANIFYTDKHKEEFEKKGVEKSKLFVANNTFDVGERIKSYQCKKKHTILFVGSLDKRKQNEILLKAFSKIKDRLDKNISLSIIGNGKEEIKLKELVNKEEMNDKVVFLGRINDPKLLGEHYRTAIATVSFGQAGLSVLQSLGFGVPFITKKNAISGGEITNIKTGFNGILCEDDINSLESSLLKVCLDIKYSRLLGKNAYDYYTNHCTIKNMVKGFIDAIEGNKTKN